jgi:hypothetical protein
MRRFALFLLISFASVISYGQAPLSPGKIQINGGLGLGSGVIPVFVGFDYGIQDQITAGAELSYWRESYRYLGGSFSLSVIGIGAHGNYHFGKVLDLDSNIDLYAGLNLGYYVVNSSNSFGGSSSGLGLGGQLGGRYFFKDNLGVLVEFGGGTYISNGKVGLTFLLK